MIDQYLIRLSQAANEMDIWDAIKQIIEGFNKLNVEYDFIETSEREELAAYIQDAAKAVGLVFDGDITEEWRMEW